MNDKTDNRKHRPPRSVYMIKELVEMGKYEQAQQWCDENVEFYRGRVAEMQDLYMQVERRKRGYRDVPEEAAT